MPSETNIKKQIASETQQSSTTRRHLFKKVENSLGGRVLVTLFTSFVHPVQIADEDLDMLQNVLQMVDTSKGIALMISSPGGDGLVAERIVNACRAFSGTGDYWAIVPSRAKSAGTIVAMGASKIMMPASAELGPVDPQIIRKEGDKWKLFSAHSLISTYDKLFSEAVATKGRLEPYLQQLNNFDAREIENYRNLMLLSEDIAVKILAGGMMSGMKPDDIKEKIKVFLNPDAGTRSHSRPIFGSEATACGINVETIDVRSPLWTSIHELYARTEMFVSKSACKAVESRVEAFYVATAQGMGRYA